MALTREKIIYLLILLNPVWEVIHATLYRADINVPINQILRMATFAVFLCFVKSQKTFLKILGFTFMYLCIWIFQICVGYSEFQFSEITFIFKIIYATSLLYIFIDYIKHNVVDIDRLIKVTIYSTFIILFSVCISPLGLGYESWLHTEYRTGYVGWFLFGNYLTIVILIALSLLFVATKMKYKLVWAFFMVVTILLLGNKAGLIGVAAYGIVFWCFYVYNTKITKRKALLIIVSIVIVIALFPFAVDYVMEFVRSQIALYKQWGFTNIFSFLLSNRDWHLYYIEKYISSMEYSKVLGLLIGYGYGNITSVLGSVTSASTIEMDMHALRYYVGILPMLIWGNIYVKNVVWSFRFFIKNKNMKSVALLLGILLTIAHSVMTGHIIFESLVIMYFAILGSIILTSDISKK